MQHLHLLYGSDTAYLASYYAALVIYTLCAQLILAGMMLVTGLTSLAMEHTRARGGKL